MKRKTKFFVARHVWRHDDKAEWLVSPDFPLVLLDHIKTTYTNLVRVRERSVKIGQHIALLYYAEHNDRFDRPVIDITAVLVQKKIANSAKRRAEIKRAIDCMGPDGVSIIFDCPPAPRGRAILLFTILLILILIAFWIEH